ncbi:hypothetical protein BH18VER2_BH18VER2_05400 [soil metagenome]
MLVLVLVLVLVLLLDASSPPKKRTSTSTIRSEHLNSESRFRDSLVQFRTAGKEKPSLR